MRARKQLIVFSMCLLVITSVACRKKAPIASAPDGAGRPRTH
jgi:hypothetical protein